MTAHKFDLSGVTVPIAAAQLVLAFPAGAYQSVRYPSGEGIQLFDVTSDPNSFGFNFAAGVARPFSATVYNDLGTGVGFGGRGYSPADEGTLTVIDLNADAVAAINAAAGGVFCIGGKSSSGGHGEILFENVPPDALFANTGLETDPRFGLPFTRQLILTPVSEPLGFTCPGDKTVPYGSNWMFDPPVILSTCCGTNVTVQLISSNAISTSACVTVWQGVWRVTDCCTNSATCTQTVSVLNVSATAVNTYANPGYIGIRDHDTAAPYPSIITVSGLPDARITKLTVRLNKFGHEYPGDVDMLLVGPTGRSVLLMSDAGGGVTAWDQTLVFDDDAPGEIPRTGPVLSGT